MDKIYLVTGAAGHYGHGHLTQLVIDYLNHRLTAAVNGGYDFVDVRDVADGINSYFLHDKATKELNYNPRPMRETLKDTADWLANIGRVKKF